MGNLSGRTNLIGLVTKRRAPEWWWREKIHPLGAATLAPLSWGYRLGGLLKRWMARPRHSPVPVISVGSALVGGSGKTPCIIALVRLLKTQGYEPLVFSRGYAGQCKDPTYVVAGKHTAQEVGDEPLEIVRECPVWVAAKRSSVLDHVSLNPNNVILLDDGHQHHSLIKTASLLVYNENQALGNGHVLPWGPLREPWEAALKRADGVIFVRAHGQSDFYNLPQCLQTSPVPVWQVVPRVTCTLEKGTSVVAFAGLGYPDQFFKSIQSLGLILKGSYAFPDHYPYTLEDVRALERRAAHENAVLVTTQKDLFRLPQAIERPIFSVSVNFDFYKNESFSSWLLFFLKKNTLNSEN